MSTPASRRRDRILHELEAIHAPAPAITRDEAAAWIAAGQLTSRQWVRTTAEALPDERPVDALRRIANP